MKLADMEQVQSLKQALETAESVVREFEGVKSRGIEVVDCFAVSSDDMLRRGVRVKVLPVPVDNAISAAIRDVSKIKAQLQQLGVTL